ncbi:glycosyltransferase family 25 protein [Mycolicibacterium houstonense]|uniref:glycosyltransferase family 25 protein n=1 Tax=Mycolicibacterium houstonense TaxID=146021 RepID=UPI00093AACAE|nr:glycosyltransferase family 25 protein [Mycolicibacterium houstonense]
MTHHTAIVAHLTRSAAAHQLMEEASATFASFDNGTRGCSGNHRRCLEWASTKDAEWAVILEDDAILCDNWADNLSHALELAPAPILSFYLGTSYPIQWQRFIRQAATKATDNNAAWIIGEQLLHAVAYAIRVEHIPDLLAHKSKAPIDEAITEWARANGHMVAYTWPSMVEHRDEPTLVTHQHANNKPRKAWQHGQPTWNTTQVRLG